jgi:hypothetical protein
MSAIFHKSKLHYRRFIESQELLLFLFLALVWISIPIGIPNETLDEHAIKMTKITVMLFIASHIVTNLKRYEIIVYLFIATGLFLGIETYTAPSYYFAAGRLGGGIGGGDLLNGNMLAAHFIMVLSLLGVMFMKGGYRAKFFCFLAAGFMLNGIILIRSRGSFLGLMAAGIAALLLSKGVKKTKIIFCLLAAIIGAATLVDSGFLQRMDEITFDSQAMDASAQSRIEIWNIGLRMSADHPLGVGVGNSAKAAAEYNLAYEGLDMHNTFLRCLSDLGIQALVVLLLIIGNAFRTLSFISRNVAALPNRDSFLWHIYAVKVGLIGYLVTVFFVSATYTEDFYWFLMLPTFLKRAFENSSEKVLD